MTGPDRPTDNPLTGPQQLIVLGLMTLASRERDGSATRSLCQEAARALSAAWTELAGVRAAVLAGTAPAELLIDALYVLWEHYLNHDEDCRHPSDMSAACTCGLNDAMARVSVAQIRYLQARGALAVGAPAQGHADYASGLRYALGVLGEPYSREEVVDLIRTRYEQFSKLAAVAAPADDTKARTAAWWYEQGWRNAQRYAEEVGAVAAPAADSPNIPPLQRDHEAEIRRLRAALKRLTSCENMAPYEPGYITREFAARVEFARRVLAPQTEGVTDAEADEAMRATAHIHIAPERLAAMKERVLGAAPGRAPAPEPEHLNKFIHNRMRTLWRSWLQKVGVVTKESAAVLVHESTPEMFAAFAADWFKDWTPPPGAFDPALFTARVSGGAPPAAPARTVDERAVLDYAANRLRSEAEYGPDEERNQTDQSMARLLEVMRDGPAARPAEPPPDDLALEAIYLAAYHMAGDDALDAATVAQAAGLRAVYNAGLRAAPPPSEAPRG